MKQKLILLTFIVFLAGGLIVRLKDLSSPLADWHSWRQTDTASVAREYVKHGIDLLHPTYHDLSAVPSGKDNLNGYRMVEFPLISGLVAFLYRSIPQLQTYELHVVYRFIDIIFSLLSAFMLFLIMKKVESSFTGLVTAAAFLFLPYNIFYSRTVLPEVSMVTLSLLAIYFGLRFIDKQRFIDACCLVVTTATALLLKPIAVFLIIPLIPYAISQRGLKVLIKPRYVFIAILAIIPLIWWRNWITQFPEGIPASSWLLNGNGIRFKGSFFYWIFADRISRIILGYWGIIPLALGILAKKKSNLPLWLTISSLAYLFIFATGNVQHDYYQIPLVPAISILIAYGIQYLRRLPASVSARYGLIIISTIFSIAFGWYHVRGLFSINNQAIVVAGRAVDALTPPDALVIAPYMGDTAFLYQTNRRGWPIGFDIENRIQAGASYYVSTNLDDETRQLMDTYTLIQQTPEYTLIKLEPQTALTK